jgi:hypothetical protein
MIPYLTSTPHCPNPAGSQRAKELLGEEGRVKQDSPEGKVKAFWFWRHQIEILCRQQYGEREVGRKQERRHNPGKK